MLISPYKAVIFDFDDTLVQTIDRIKAHHKYSAKKFYNIDLTDEVFNKYYGMPFDQMLPLLYQNKDSLENMKKNYSDSYIKKFYKQLQSNSLHVVRKILDMDKKVGIVTATTTDKMNFDLKRLNFPYKEFIFVQTQDDTKYHKPDPRVFDPMFKILSKFGIINSEIVYIGDAIRDYTPAKEAGIGFIGITSGITSLAEFEAVGAKAITDLMDLIKE